MSPEERDQQWIKAAGPELAPIRAHFLLSFQAMAQLAPEEDRWRVVGSMMETAILQVQRMPEYQKAFAEALYAAADGFAVSAKEKANDQ